MATLPKRQSSRRKAKDNSSTKRILQEKMLAGDEGEEEDVDLTDSDDDATWTPFKDKDKNRGESNSIANPGTKKRSSLDDDEFSPKKPKKANHQTTTNSSQAVNNLIGTTTNLVPEGSELKTGDFIVLTTEADSDSSPIWRLDSKTLLQRYNPFQTATGEYHHKSANLFTGFMQSKRDKYSSVAVRFINVDSNSYTVKVIKKATTSSGDRLVILSTF